MSRVYNFQTKLVQRGGGAEDVAPGPILVLGMMRLTDDGFEKLLKYGGETSISGVRDTARIKALEKLSGRQVYSISWSEELPLEAK